MSLNHVQQACYLVKIRQETRSHIQPLSFRTSMMSSSSSFQPTTIDTFSSRVAPRPRVVPVYATSIPRRSKRPLSIHQTLRVKPIFHPYKTDRPAPIGISPPSPLDRSVDSSKVASPPPSPLTEPEDSMSSLSGVRVILVPPPNANVNLKNAGWSQSLKAGYRVSSSSLELLPISSNISRGLLAKLLIGIWIPSIVLVNKPQVL